MTVTDDYHDMTDRQVILAALAVYRAAEWAEKLGQEHVDAINEVLCSLRGELNERGYRVTSEKALSERVA